MSSHISDPIYDEQIPPLYRSIASIGLFPNSTNKANIITQQTKARIKLEKSKTNYYEKAKFKVKLAKHSGLKSTKNHWFLDPERKPEIVKRYLLELVNSHNRVYDLLLNYVILRTFETCNQKTVITFQALFGVKNTWMDVEIGRKPQRVSTDTNVTFPFPPEIIWLHAHVPECFRNKLNSWVNSSFSIYVPDGEIEVHSEEGSSNVSVWGHEKSHGHFETMFDGDTRWTLEIAYANSPALTDKNFTVDLSIGLFATGVHPDFFMPDYFTSVCPRPWTGELIQVFSSSGDSRICFLAALKCNSPVLETQLRWNNEIPLTLELPSEVFEPFIEFISYSHVTAATNSFKLAVELLFAANKYDVKDLQDYLLDLFYVQPLCWFDDAEALVELYLLLEVTRASEVVLKRVEGIVKLKASSILSNQIYHDLEPRFKSSISSLINSYDVVLDLISLWTDNRHATRIAEKYSEKQARLNEYTRIQGIHKRKPWQLCCDYVNYCNYKTNDVQVTEVPYGPIKITRRFFGTNIYCCGIDLKRD